jgi:methanogenic corrinoid protein MtbC1
MMSEKKLYSIGKTSKQSGVPIETVRIWERRYQVIVPTRTQGGHRKYTEEDIEVLGALRVLVEGGARIGSVARLSRDEILAAAFPATPAAGREADVEAAIAAAVRFDEAELRDLLKGPLETQPVLEVARQFYMPLLSEIGERWHEGQVSVAAEHMVEKEVSGIIHHALQDLPGQPSGTKVVAACLEGDRHEVGLLVSCLLMRARNLAVTYLGADLPTEDLTRVVDRQQPDLVVLAALQPPNDPIIRRLNRALGEGGLKKSEVWIGGFAAENTVSRLTKGRAIAFPNLGRFLVHLDKWMRKRPPAPQPEAGMPALN